MLTEVLPCEPPEALRERACGPTQPVDQRIVGAVQTSPNGLQLAEITKAVGGTTHYIHARVQALVDRGVLHRRPLPGGPRRGPGASVYLFVTKARSWTCPS